MTCKKVKLSRYTPWRHMGERRYSSYSFLTSALDGGEWSASRPGRALFQGKGPLVPIVQEAGWAPEPVWTHDMYMYSYLPHRIHREDKKSVPNSSECSSKSLRKLKLCLRVSYTSSVGSYSLAQRPVFRKVFPPAAHRNVSKT
jgi:hypothetical protein